MTTASPTQASNTGNAVDQIADLLIDEPETQDAAAAEGEDEQENQNDLVSGEVEDTDGEDGGVKGEEEEEEEKEEEGEPEVTWASALGIDDAKIALDEDGNLSGVNVKVDGEEAQVDLNTLIAGYQTAKSTTQKSQFLSEERRKFEEQADMAAQTFQNKMAEAEEFIKILHKQVTDDFSAENWQQLRQSNPAEYAIKLHEHNQRSNELAQMMQQVKAQQELVQEQQKKNFETKHQEYLKAQVVKTLEIFPEWHDREVANKAFSELHNFAVKQGFTSEEFGDITDPRALKILSLALNNSKAAPTADKKLKKPVPTFQKSTRSRSRGKKPTKLDKLVKRAKTAKGYERTRAQTDAVAELLLGDK